MFLIVSLVEFRRVLGVDINVHHENPATFLCHISASSVKRSRRRAASSRWHPGPHELRPGEDTGHQLGSHVTRHVQNSGTIDPILRLIEAHRNEIRTQPASARRWLDRSVWRKRSIDAYADRGRVDVSATNLWLDCPGAAGGACAVDHRGTACRCRLGRGLFLVDCFCRADRPIGIGRLHHPPRRYSHEPNHPAVYRRGSGRSSPRRCRRLRSVGFARERRGCV